MLESYRLSCEAAGRYEEAGRTLEQSTRLRQEEEARRISVLKSQHARARATLAAAHAEQSAAFQTEWDTFFANFDAAANEHIARTRARHVLELKAYQDAAHAELLRTPFKLGKELLEWRSREQLLAKQRKYADAVKIKAVADDMERMERSKWDTERLASHGARETRFLGQQTAELAAIAERVGRKRAEYMKQSVDDAGRLHQRNRNALTVLEHRHISLEERFISTVRSVLASSLRQGQVTRAAAAAGVHST